ncbi:conserved hypothetical protein [Neospora caninum Liverpool]|nr:conserved hypothetical protein [Neospora caninum Liverpool]CBZ55914.1 conserved hypothetical protein [Neospora caninum Liverpool]|eukprot:XP_003885940.1 conserved hypothetical protein [Neospora caninum Liverpool]
MKAVAWRLSRAQRPPVESVLHRISATYQVRGHPRKRARLSAPRSFEDFEEVRHKLGRQQLRWGTGAVFCVLQEKNQRGESPFLRAGAQASEADPGLLLYLAVSDAMLFPPRVAYELLRLAHEEFESLVEQNGLREKPEEREAEGSSRVFPRASAGAGFGERHAAARRNGERCAEEESGDSEIARSRDSRQRVQRPLENFLHLLLILPEPRLLSNLRRQLSSSSLSSSSLSSLSASSVSVSSPSRRRSPASSQASIEQPTPQVPSYGECADVPGTSSGLPASPIPTNQQDAERQLPSAPSSSPSSSSSSSSSSAASASASSSSSSAASASASSWPLTSPFSSLPFRFLCWTSPAPGEDVFQQAAPETSFSPEIRPARVSLASAPGPRSLPQLANVAARVQSLNVLLEDNLRLLYSSSASLEVLEQKTSSLSGHTRVFAATSRHVRRIMWFKSKTVFCIVVGAVVLAVFVVWVL